MKKSMICAVLSMMLRLPMAAAVSTAGKGVMLMNRIGPSSADLFIDLNSRVVPGYAKPGLPAYALADLTVSRTVGRHLDAFAGVQNLFDRQYFVGTLPTTIGSPRFVNGGLRIRFAGR